LDWFANLIGGDAVMHPIVSFLVGRGRCLQLAFLLLLLLSWATLSRAQETLPYDIRHYDLLIEPSFVRQELRITCTVWVDNPNLADTFDFGLSDQYKVISVSAAGSSASVERSAGSVSVKTRPRKSVKLTFRLLAHSPKSDDEDRDVIEKESLFLLWSDRFYPIRFNDWATVRTTIVLPPSFQAIAPGKLVKQTRMEDTVRYVFNTSQPTVQFSVFADSRWIRTTRKINGLRMETLLYPGSQKFSEQIFASSSDILRFYSEWFGPYQAAQFSFVTLSGMYARRAFAEFVGYEPKYLEKEMTTTGFDAHETALLWWGYTTRGSGPGSWQWTEGLGDYAEVLYDEARHKPLPEIFQYFREEYLKLPTDKDVPYTKLRGSTSQTIVHGKYPWLMHVMRYMIGDEPFRKAMRLVFERYRFRTFSMDEFIAAVEEASGKSLRQWREQWLERKGVPAVALRYQVEAGEPNRIRGTLEQEGELYDLPLELGIETKKGLQIEKIQLTERKQNFEIESAEKPLRVTLDPHGWLLMKKIYK
jgi:hypothetical protein